MVDAGTAVLNIKPNFAGAAGAVESEGRGVFGGLGKSMAVAFAGGFAITKGVDLFKDSIDQAREAIKVQNQTAAVIASTGGAAGISAVQVEELGKKIGNLDGLNHDAVQSTENLLLTFRGISGVGGDKSIFARATSEVQDMSVAMKEDGKSAAIQLGKALEDPVKGVGALRRIGVMFTEDQKKVIESMVRTGNVAGAQGVILDEVAKEFGGSAAAQADPLKRLGVQWKLIEEELGLKLLPVVNKLAAGLAVLLPKALDLLGAGFHKLEGAVHDVISGFKLGVDTPGLSHSFWADLGHDVSVFIEAFRTGSSAVKASGFAGIVQDIGVDVRQAVDDIFKLAGILKDALSPAFSAVADFVTSKVLPALGDNLGPIVKALTVGLGVLAAGAAFLAGSAALGAIVGALGAVVAAIASPIVLIAALAAGLAFAWQKSETFRDIVKGAMSIAGDAFTGVKDAVAAVGSAVKDAVGDVENSKLGDDLVDIGDRASKGFDKAKKALGGLVDDVASGLKSPTQKSLIDQVMGMQGGFDVKKQTGMGELRSAFATGWDDIKNDSGGAWASLQNDAALGTAGILQKVLDFAPNLKGDFANTWDDVQKTAHDGAHGVNQAFDDLVSGQKTLPQFLGDIAHNAMQTAKDAFSVGMDQIKIIWDIDWSGLRNKAAEIWNDISNNVGLKIGEILNTLRGWALRADDAIGDTHHVLLHKGVDLVQGLLDGVSSAWGYVAGFFASLPGRIANAVSNPGSALVGVGRALIGGLIGGIESMVQSAINSVTGALGSIVNRAKSFLGIHSPSTVFHEIGQNIGAGLTSGIAASTPAVHGAITGMLNGPVGLADMATNARPVTRAFTSADAASVAATGVVNNINGPVTIGNSDVVADLDWYSKVRFAGL